MDVPVTRRQIVGALGAIAAAPSAAGADGDQRMEITTVLERYAAAWQANDLPALVASYHDDFTLHYFGRSPLAGEHRGRPAALRVLADVGRRTNRRLVAIVDVLAGRRRGAIVAREAFQRDSLTAEVERVFVYTVRDGRLHECWVYDADQELVDRFLT